MKLWEVENISDECLDSVVYMRVHKNNIDSDGNPTPGAFRNHASDNGMSMEWARYCTPHETAARARIPAENKVLKFHVRDLQNAELQQRLSHCPTLFPQNRAHANLFGTKSAEVRIKLRRIASWAF